MSNDTLATPPPAPAPGSPQDLGLDREFVAQMARVPVIAAAFAAVTAAAAWACQQAGWAWEFGTAVVNPAPVVLISLGMIAAAVIDGLWFKVPNWLTLPLVLSGWLLGLLHDLGLPVAGPAHGGLADSRLVAALVCTVVGFFLLFPILFIGGMGQGDVKMQMGFGAWVGMIFGTYTGSGVLLYAFCCGVVAGGVIGLVMMGLRRQFDTNLNNMKEIVTDLQVMVTESVDKAKARAQARRPSWYRLPYGVPLCLGFVGYLLWLHFYPA